MEQRPPKPMTPFDELTMPPQFRMLKLMLPFTPDTMRPMLAVFIKFMELQHTIRLVSENPAVFSAGKFMFSSPNSTSQEFSLNQIDDILPYLSPKESEMFESMRSMMNIMEMMQMMQGMQTNQDTSESSGLNPMDFLQNMLSPDQQELFRGYQHILDDEPPASEGN